MEIAFKVSVGSVVLLSRLPFVLLQHLDMKFPSRIPWALFVDFPHLDMEIPFKASSGSVVPLRHLDM